MQRYYPEVTMKYSVKAAAIATGVSESSLRTWERRYGVPTPARSPSGRRQYEEHDLAVIRRMAALVSAGIPASEAADAIKREDAAAMADEPVPVVEHPLVGELVDASLAYDEPSITKIVQQALKSGWAAALGDVLFPALNLIGLYWGEGRVSCATEHFTTEVIRRELAAAIAARPRAPDGAPGVLLACPEAERHDLGLLALALLLSRRGLRIFYLGADVPAHDLLIAIEKTGVQAVCLSATTASGLASLGRTAREVVADRAVRRLFFGGPAFWRENGDETIPGIRLPRELDAAAETIAEALGEVNP
jgi:DNA-binding transcriptional MerR regulator